MNSDFLFLDDVNQYQQFNIPNNSIINYIESKRIMPAGSPKPGPFSFEWTPYLKELQEDLSPNSPIQETVGMKSAQLGFTEILLNTIGYYIDEYPTNILYVSSTEALLERFSAEKLEPMIDSLRLRKKFMAPIDTSETESMTRRGGDKVLLKHYPGGTLAMASLNSMASLRSASVKILLLDEIDGVKFTSPEGRATSIASARTDAYRNRKIGYISTPTVNTTSNIARLYEQGDQRKFFIPCPHCNEFIDLRFKQLSKTDDGILYFCQECGAAIEEYQKHKLMLQGYWKPTATSKQGPFFRSRHMNSLYSQTLDWGRIYQEFINARDSGEEEAMRSFVNLRLGKPYKESGERPRIERINSLRSETPEGEVPEFILYTTLAVDVQSGGKKQDPRLCINVVGHGSKMRKAILFYEEIIGALDNPYEGAWKEFYDKASAGKYNFSRRSDGYTFAIQLASIDAGDGNMTSTVFEFCKRLGKAVFPLKGFAQIGKTRIKKYLWVEQSSALTQIRQIDRTDKTRERYLQINTTYYKNIIYNNIPIKRDNDADFQPYGYIHFNKNLDDNYFKMLTAEEKNREGAFINPSKKRNEALDCLVYNYALGDFWLETKASERAKSVKVTLIELHKHRGVPCDLLDKFYDIS